VTDGLIELGLGAMFVWWSRWFPGQMLQMRERIAARGGNVPKFQTYLDRPLIRVGPKVVLVLGALLMVLGIVSLVT
jgi:hypothetical protein